MKRILVVEDSPVQAALVTSDLEGAGFDVEHAADGEAALELLRGETPFDLVLTDVVMPGIDGYELCRHIREEHGELPVILLTSLDDPIEIVHGLEAGADNFLRKPYQRDQLVSRIRNVLLHRDMRAGGRASMGLEVMLREQRFMITAERQQILDLLVTSFEDLVESNRALREREEALRRSEEALRAQLAATELERRRLTTVLEASPNPMVIADSDGTITDASSVLCDLLGCDRDELVGRAINEAACFLDPTGAPFPMPVWSPSAVADNDEPVVLGTAFDLFIRGGGDAPIPVMAKAAPVKDSDGRTTAIVGTLQEIGALAAHDSTTRMPNQALFADRVARAAAAGRPMGRRTAVVAVLVERFALLSSTLRPEELEEVVARVADRLREHVQPVEGASAAYFGHGTFAVVVPHLQRELDGFRFAHDLRERFATEEVHVGDERLPFDVVLGVAVDSGSEDPVSLVASATAAARRGEARRDGSVVIADATIDARADDWLRRQAALRSAIDEGELVVHYQPEVDLRTGRAWGVEALVRWQHPERGLIPPGEFLPLAQETALIVPLGWRVLETTCRQVAAWRRGALAGGEAMKIAVNVDVTQLMDPDVAERVRTILDDTGMDPGALTLEITEHGVVADADVATERIAQLRKLGVTVAIDDFGTGYSSLVQLRRLPVDYLKVDQSFVGGMIDLAEDAAIVAASIRLGRALGMGLVAEGIENVDQVAALRRLGCDIGQGYLFARPMPAEELAEWWSDRVGVDLLPKVGDRQTASH